jgi:ubiquinone/menaquinone biosynthesis C-methylase UbiE
MGEINLLKNYPKTNRNLSERSKKTIQQQEIARMFGKDFFDGDRSVGYGGFNYNKKYWDTVVQDFIGYYRLNHTSHILDVGCGKGFMLYDFSRYLPGAYLRGLDISEYAINNSLKEIKKNLDIGCCSKLPYKDNAFDLVISINTIHNLELEKCKIAIQEIARVSRRNAFIIVDAYKNNQQKKDLFDWNLTAKTILHQNEWLKLFEESNYKGDYFWFCP